MNIEEKNELLLTQLIFMFQTAALQQMGKLKNPIADKIEQDLQQAQISIDMLEMLHAKTKSNLTRNEEKIFNNVLTELKLNYVDEVGKAGKSGQQPSPAAEPASPESTPNPSNS
jgi:uncharacterized membrane protein YheB (UPF0754 family)